MSAYMPVKHSWSIEGLRLSRTHMRIVLWIVSSLCACALITALVLFTMAGLKGGEIAQLPSGVSAAIAAQSARAERDHGFIVVQGLAANRDARPARNLLAVVELFDTEGALRGVESSLVETPLLAANEESPFVVRLPDPGNIRSFRVRFRQLGGAP